MKQTGQTLIELIISIALILIIITGVTILTVQGLQNSQFSRNQVQATKLAQEGIEKMRTIRDNNYTVCGWSTNANAVAPNGLWSAACPNTGCRYLIKQSAGTCNNIASTSLWIQYTPTTTTTESIIAGSGGTTFNRSVIVTDDVDLSGASTAFVKKIDVIVSWSDSSGTHDSKVSTILSRI
jgi:Tfp pilus assembly protein PilV